MITVAIRQRHRSAFLPEEIRFSKGSVYLLSTSVCLNCLVSLYKYTAMAKK